MADASHGCNPNCADLLAAAVIRAIRNGVVVLIEKMCWKSSDPVLTSIHEIANKKPISPIRL